MGLIRLKKNLEKLKAENSIGARVYNSSIILINKYNEAINMPRTTQIERITRNKKIKKTIKDLTARELEINKFKRNKKSNDKANTLKELKEKGKINIPIIGPKRRIRIDREDKLEKINKFGGGERGRVTLAGNISSIDTMYNKLLEYRAKLERAGNAVNFFVIFFKNLTNSGVAPRSFKADILDSLQEFSDYVRIIQEEGDISGSDRLDEENYELILDKFDYVLINELVGNSMYKGEMYFKTEKINSDGDCGYICLKKLYPELNLTLEEYKVQELNKLSNMGKYIIEHNLNIVIIGNIVRFKKYELIFNPEKCVIIKEGKKNKKYYKIENDENLSICYLFQNVLDEDKIKYMILDNEEEHFDVLLNNKIELNNVYFERDSTPCIKTGETFNKFSTATEYKKESDNYYGQKKAQVKEEYLFIDYEAVTDWKTEGVNKAYSLSMFHADESILDKLELLEKKGKNNKELQKEIKEFIENNTRFWLGYDCTQKLDEYMRKSGDNTIFRIITFNGSCYDNFILYNDLVKNNCDYIGSPFFAGTRLLNFKINGRHDLFDLKRHLAGSLDFCCKAFKIELFSKKSFDHDVAQEHYDKGDLMEYMKNNKEIEEYNIYDVLSLGLLFKKYKDSYKNIKGFEYLSDELCEHKTLGSGVMDRLNKYWKEKKINFPLFYKPSKDFKNKEMAKIYNKRMLQYYDDLLKYKIAGRVELFNGMIKVLEQVVSLDVCSLYPYVMSVLDVYYPTNGEIKEVEKYEDMPKDKIGFFYCDIDQSILILNNKPLIYAEKDKNGNNWDTKNILKNYLISTVMIDLMKKHNVKIDIRNGFYFTEKSKSVDIFEPLLHLMKIKNEQDKYKKEDEKNKNTEGYKTKCNMAIRETTKASSNIVSGKLIEGLHLDKISLMNSYDIHELKRKGLLDRLNLVNMSGEKLLVSLKKEQEEEMKNAKPVYLGVLIYDYAKTYMYENMYSQIESLYRLYTDTDSCKFKIEGFYKWYENYGKHQIVRHWPEVEKYDERYKNHKIYDPNSKVYGSFENEYKKENDVNIFISKKNYLSTTSMIYKENKTEEDIKYIENITKCMFKGINIKRDVLLPDGFSITKEEDDDYDENDDIIDDKTTQEYLYKIYKSSPKIKDDLIGLFEKLLEEKRCEILTFSMSRVAKCTNGNMCSVVSGYKIKSIEIK